MQKSQKCNIDFTTCYDEEKLQSFKHPFFNLYINKYKCVNRLYIKPKINIIQLRIEKKNKLLF